MTRGADTVVIKPGNNIYTVLAVVATLVTYIALIVLFVRANTIFPDRGLL